MIETQNPAPVMTRRGSLFRRPNERKDAIRKRAEKALAIATAEVDREVADGEALRVSPRVLRSVRVVKR